MYINYLFGLHIESDFDLPAPISFAKEADILIKKGKCVEPKDDILYRDDTIIISKNHTWLNIPTVGCFYLSDGSSITVEPNNMLSSKALIISWILGACIIVLLQHRGIISIHGSCLYKDSKTMIITGNSGAGKSSLASKFISEGWLLMSDDVIPIIIKDGICYAQSTFPAQKMWEDCVEANHASDRIIGEPVWEEDGRYKYMIDASSYYHEGKEKIDYIIALTKGTEELECSEITGFPKTDLFMKNTYRTDMIYDKEGKQNVLRTCMMLGKQVRAFLAERPVNMHAEQAIYDYVMNQISE